MPDEEQSLPDDEELVLPEEDHLEEQRRKQLANLPARAKTSPLLRKIIVGGAGEKAKDLAGQKPRMEIKARGRSAPKVEESSEHPPLELPTEAEATGGGESGPEGGELEGALVGGANGPQRVAVEGAGGASGGLMESAPAPLAWEEGDSPPGTMAPIPDPGASGKPRRRKRRHRKEGEFSEETWSGRGGSALWWWLTAGVVCLGFVAILIVLRHKRSSRAVEVAPAERVAYDDSIESTPVADFMVDSEALAEELDELVKRLEAGQNLDGVVRGGAASAALLAEWRKRRPAPAPVQFNVPRRLNALAIKDFGFAVLMGQREDYTPFAFYFVKEGDEMRLDWEASEGFSEILPEEVPALSDREPRMMRALVGITNFYTDLYPEDRYQCYTLQQFDPESYVWAFAVRESAEDMRLRATVFQRSPWGNQRRMMVKLRRGVEGSRPNQVEIVEVLQQDWIVSPAKKSEGVDPDGDEPEENPTQ